MIAAINYSGVNSYQNKFDLEALHIVSHNIQPEVLVCLPFVVVKLYPHKSA